MNRIIRHKKIIFTQKGYDLSLLCKTICMCNMNNCNGLLNQIFRPVYLSTRCRENNYMLFLLWCTILLCYWGNKCCIYLSLKWWLLDSSKRWQKLLWIEYTIIYNTKDNYIHFKTWISTNSDNNQNLFLILYKLQIFKKRLVVLEFDWIF